MIRGELVSDRDDLPCKVPVAQRAGDALVSGADVVDAGEVGMALEKIGRLDIGLLEIVAHFPQFDDLEVGEFLGEDVPEPHLAFFMAAIGERAREERDFPSLGALSEESAEHVAGDAPGRPLSMPT